MATKAELEIQLDKLRGYQKEELNASMKKIREKDIQKLEAELLMLELTGDAPQGVDNNAKKMHLKNQLYALQHRLSTENDKLQKQAIKTQIIMIQTELAALGEIISLSSADMQQRTGYNNIHDTSHPYTIADPWKNGPRPK